MVSPLPRTPHRRQSAPVAPTRAYELIKTLLRDEQAGIGNLSELARRLHELAPEKVETSWYRTLTKGREKGFSEAELQVIAKALRVERSRFPKDVRQDRRGEAGLRLLAVEGEVELWKEVVLEGFGLLGLRVNPEADQGSRVQRSADRGHPAGGTRK